MPKYTCSMDDEESSFESDDGTLYVPPNTIQYELSEFNPLKPISNRSIQIRPAPDKTYLGI